MRKKLKKRNSVSWVTYTVVLLIGLAMLYPIIWMFFATFKSNAEIFGSVKLLPSSFSFQSYIGRLACEQQNNLLLHFQKQLCDDDHHYVIYDIIQCDCRTVGC